MYRCETFREYYCYEDTLSSSVEECLNKNNIKQESIINIKTFCTGEYIYCMIIWEE